MLRKLACVAVLLALSIGLVAAEEFNISIRKIDGDKITAMKGQKKGEKGTEVTLSVAAGAKILKGKASKGDDGKFKIEAGDAIEDGLKNKMFSEIGDKKGINARVTTNDDGKITQIIVFGGKKKKSAE